MRRAVLTIVVALTASAIVTVLIARPCWLEHRAAGFSTWTAFVACA